MLELIIPPHYPLGRAVVTHPDLGSFRFSPCSGRGLLNLTTSDHILQDPYCRHCHTYTDEPPLLDLSDDSIG